MPLLYEDEFVIIYLDFHGKGQILPAIYRILVLLLPRENGFFWKSVVMIRKSLEVTGRL